MSAVPNLISRRKKGRRNKPTPFMLKLESKVDASLG